MLQWRARWNTISIYRAKGSSFSFSLVSLLAIEDKENRAKSSRIYIRANIYFSSFSINQDETHSVEDRRNGLGLNYHQHHWTATSANRWYQIHCSCSIVLLLRSLIEIQSNDLKKSIDRYWQGSTNRISWIILVGIGWFIEGHFQVKSDLIAIVQTEKSIFLHYSIQVESRLTFVIDYRNENR